MILFKIKVSPLHSKFSVLFNMQNKTDKETLLVPKSLPVVNLNSVNR